jgi:hypothetical protein
MLFSPDGSLVFLGEKAKNENNVPLIGQEASPGIVEIWRVSDGSRVYTSRGKDRSRVPWETLFSAAVAQDGSLVIASFREEVPGTRQRNEERRKEDSYAESEEEFAAVYVWQAEWSDLINKREAGGLAE